jgi:hypothetical protein
VRQRRASALLLVLVVLFAGMVVVGGVQYFSLTRIRQARTAMDAEDGLLRADGLVEMLLSRWRRRLTIEPDKFTLEPRSGTEEGVWDSREFVMGWESEPIDGPPLRWRASVWVRFPQEKPERTLRTDLLLDQPCLLEPRIARIVSTTIDHVLPADEGQRRAAFALVARVLRDPQAAGLAEAYALRMERLAAAGRPLAELVTMVTPAAVAGPATQLGDLFAAQKAYRSATVASTRVAGAREALARAEALAPDDRPAFRDAAIHALALELGRQAEGPEPARAALLREAIDKLQPVVRNGAGCGLPRAAWTLAHLIARHRDDLANRAQFADSRRRALQTLQDARLTPGRFLHGVADILVDELPVLFDRLWRARVMTIVHQETNSGAQYTLLSIRDDGTAPIAHVESGKMLGPKCFNPDGGSVLAAMADQAFSVPLDGGRPHAILPDPLSVTGGATPLTVRMMGLRSAEFSPDGKQLILRAGFVAPGSDTERTRVVHVSGDQVSLLLEDGDFGQMAAFSRTGAIAVARRESPTQWKIERRSAAGAEPSHTGTVSSSPGSFLSGLAWHAPQDDRLALGIFDAKDTTLHFLDADTFDARETAQPPTTTVRNFKGWEQYDLADVARLATSCPRPRGYLVASMDALCLFEAPSYDTPRTLGIAGSTPIEQIRWLQTPIWGERAFFIGKHPEGSTRLFRRDLDATGPSATFELVGKSGAYPFADNVFFLVVSPVPEVSP